MDSEVFKAILALDSYNRGYNPGIAGLAGNSIGNATIIRTDGDPDAQDIGFYAIAYAWNGETIISYRGTDPHLRPSTPVLTHSRACPLPRPGDPETLSEVRS